MATELGVAAIGAAPQVASIPANAIQNSKENRRLEDQETKDNKRSQQGAQRQVEEINKALGALTNMRRSGLQAVASQQLGAGSQALDASFALNNAGAVNSGLKEQMRASISSGVMSNLAAQINQDMFQRQLAVLAAKQSPVYRDAYTPSTVSLTPGEKAGK